MRLQRLRLSFEPDRVNAFRLAGRELDADVAALESESDQSDLTKRLRGLYGKYAQSYMNLVRVDPYPVISVQIDGEDLEIILDGELFERLCDLYIIYGWRGIQNIEELLKNKQPKDEPESGGVNYPRPAPFLVAGYKFFTITRKIIAILIRQSLSLIEQKSAETIVARLKTSSVKMNEAVNSYGIKKPTKVSTSNVPMEMSDAGENQPYMMSEIAAARLYPICFDASTKMKKLEDYFRQLSESSKKQHPLSTSNVPMEMSDARETQESMILMVQKIEEEQTLLHDLLAPVRKTDPLILLAFPSMKVPFSRKTFENITGQILSSMIKELDIARGLVDPKASNVKEFVTWSGEEQTNINDFIVPDTGIELDVIENAVSNKVYALLNADVIVDLVNREEIARDSFEYAVLFHYVTALKDRRDQANREKREFQETWATIGKISSGLTIAAFVVPIGGAVVRGAIALLDLASIFNTVSSVRTVFESFDEQIRDKLVESGSEGDYSQALAQLGALLHDREEYRDALAKEVSIDLLLTFAGMSAREKSLIAKAFLVRNYYSDIRSLYDG